MALSFFNTLSRSKETFVPMTEGEAKMYTCGPTVYNFAHIGNFRAYVFEDFLRRALKYRGFNVTQVMNLTDVDDKTIRDSRAEGVPLDTFTRRYKDAFFADLAKLRVEPAEHYPAATDHIPEMIALVQTLLDKGYAYRSEDGSIYYSIAKFPRYGQLARIDLKNQRSGGRVKSDEYDKDSVADFALWKAWDENDGDVAWDSPWGKGRPGWHIECSAMSMKYLGETFDLHTGGVDNMFPHHEDEIAQSEAANGVKFVNYWLHCEHLLVNNQKMSKSLGNFFTLRQVLEKGHSPEEIRWVLLGAHYRKKLNFSFESLEQAREALKSFKELFERLRAAAASGKPGAGVDDPRAAFAAALDDDLNISEALAVVYGLQKQANRLLDAKELGAEAAALTLDYFKDFDRIFAVFDVDKAGSDDIPAEVVALAERRQQARKAKDFAASDAFRAQLTALGWAVKDTAEGFKLTKV